jgi:hypothetical protein
MDKTADRKTRRLDALIGHFVDPRHVLSSRFPWRKLSRGPPGIVDPNRIHEGLVARRSAQIIMRTWISASETFGVQCEISPAVGVAASASEGAGHVQGFQNVPRSSSSRLASNIRKLIEQRHPYFCCDTCLALHFRVSLAEAKAVALKVATEPGFRRQQAICETCGRTLELTSVTVRLRPHN